MLGRINRFRYLRVSPHDRSSLAVVDMDEGLGNAYAAERHLECLMHDVHALKAVRHSDVCRYALVVCTGFGLARLGGMGRISPAGRYAEREATYLAQLIEPCEKLRVHVVAPCSSVGAIKLSDVEVLHLRATFFVFSYVLNEPSPNMPSSTGIISLRSSGGTVIGDSVIVSIKLQTGTSK